VTSPDERKTGAIKICQGQREEAAKWNIEATAEGVVTISRTVIGEIEARKADGTTKNDGKELEFIQTRDGVIAKG